MVRRNNGWTPDRRCHCNWLCRWALHLLEWGFQSKSIILQLNLFRAIPYTHTHSISLLPLLLHPSGIGRPRPAAQPMSFPSPPQPHQSTRRIHREVPVSGMRSDSMAIPGMRADSKQSNPILLAIRPPPPTSAVDNAQVVVVSRPSGVLVLEEGECAGGKTDELKAKLRDWHSRVKEKKQAGEGVAVVTKQQQPGETLASAADAGNRVTLAQAPGISLTGQQQQPPSAETATVRVAPVDGLQGPTALTTPENKVDVKKASNSAAAAALFKPVSPSSLVFGAAPSATSPPLARSVVASPTTATAIQAQHATQASLAAAASSKARPPGGKSTFDAPLTLSEILKKKQDKQQPITTEWQRMVRMK